VAIADPRNRGGRATWEASNGALGCQVAVYGWKCRRLAGRHDIRR